MRVVDANVLIYAVNKDTPHHEDSKRWLELALNGADTVGFTWNAMLAFIRLTTHPAIFSNPLSVDEATGQLERWLSSPNAKILEPGASHLATLATLLNQAGAGGNLTNDAHLAAIAMENRASLATFDNDFSRFPGVSWTSPTDLVLEAETTRR